MDYKVYQGAQSSFYLHCRTRSCVQFVPNWGPALFNLCVFHLLIHHQNPNISSNQCTHGPLQYEGVRYSCKIR